MTHDEMEQALLSQQNRLDGLTEQLEQAYEAIAGLEERLSNSIERVRGDVNMLRDDMQRNYLQDYEVQSRIDSAKQDAISEAQRGY